jgi:ribose 1,5-bisphosphokinase
MTRGRLIYVMGASGVGKDSLIAGLIEDPFRRSQFPLMRRGITLPADEHGEGHQAGVLSTLPAVQRHDAFALCWRAGDTRYGIRRDLDHHLAAGRHPVVNGSRAAFPEVQASYPDLLAVLVTAEPATLLGRLHSRGREDAEDIERRMHRAAACARRPEPDWIVIANDRSLADARQALIAALARRLELAPPASGTRCRI